MHSFEVHSNESVRGKSGRLGLEQVIRGNPWNFSSTGGGSGQPPPPDVSRKGGGAPSTGSLGGYLNREGGWEHTRAPPPPPPLPPPPQGGSGVGGYPPYPPHRHGTHMVGSPGGWWLPQKPNPGNGAGVPGPFRHLRLCPRSFTSGCGTGGVGCIPISPAPLMRLRGSRGWVPASHLGGGGQWKGQEGGPHHPQPGTGEGDPVLLPGLWGEVSL